MKTARAKKPAAPKKPDAKAPPAKKTTTAKIAEARPEFAPAPKPKPGDVKVTPAKGRPMLSWVGKRPLNHVTAFPAQLVETYSAHDSPSPAQRENPASGGLRAGPGDEGGRLYHGDNKEVPAHLLANGCRGKVKLIYIDPPFDSGADYVRKVQLRGAKGAVNLQGENYTLGEQIQYTDIWANDNYLQFMYERLLLLKELSAFDGSMSVII